MAHGGVNIIVKGSSLWTIRPSTNFMDLALCPWSFPDTMTSQSLTLLSVMNHSIPEQALARQGLMGVCNSDTIPGKGGTDLLWPPLQHKVLHFPQRSQISSESLRTFCILVAKIMISVLVDVTWTSTPEYPSSASSHMRNSFSSALKMPTVTEFLFLEISTTILPSCSAERKVLSGS